MTRRPVIGPFGALLCASALVAQESQAPSFEQQLAAIVPQREAGDWQTLPWRAELGAALLEASAADRPVLLWAMNGHPLGQT